MKLMALSAVVAVAVANVMMNVLVWKAAGGASSYWRALGSRGFALALLAGTCSILTLLLVYRLRVNVAQGIVLMGAASIVGGSVFGVLALKNRLAAVEWILLVTIAALFVIRWVAARPSAG